MNIGDWKGLIGILFLTQFKSKFYSINTFYFIFRNFWYFVFNYYS